MAENIELWTYTLYENGILEIKMEGSSQISDKKGKQITRVDYTKYDLKHHLNKTSKELQQKFNEVREKILELPNVQERAEQKSGVTYRSSKSFARFEFNRNSIDLLLRQPKYNDPQNLVRDISSFEWGFKGMVKVTSKSDSNYLFNLIKQSYLEIS